jgi:hypothetical protein
MIEFGLGILGGIVAWLGTMVIGQPFYELINLRRETAWLLHLYELKGRDDHRATITGWLEDRAKAYQACAAKLLAFASSQMIVTAAVRLPPLRWQPREAGESLWLLSPLGPGAPERAQLRLDVAKALNLSL